MDAITFHKDSDGIVILTMDLPNRSANLLNEMFYEAFNEALDKIDADESATGVILLSGKPRIWVAGADIDNSFGGRDARFFFEASQKIKRYFRHLETLGRPVVAALNGTALGGGMELALACHYRVALNDDRIKFGFPEVGLGLLPGAGGVVRTPRLIGMQKGLEWLSQIKKYTPAQALAEGMIHALAANREDLIAQARHWIRENPNAQAPWDAAKRYQIPGGGPQDPHVAQMLAVAPAMVRKETKGNYPAPIAILSAMVEGCQVDLETAGRIESRYFAHLASGQVSKNMINALWTQLNQIKKGASRPQQVPRTTTSKVGVLGAGMMGHGIAFVSALSGMEVVLIDTSQERANAGKEKIAALMEKRMARGRMTSEQMGSALAKVRATADYGRLEGCDLVIEAVFENRELKARVTPMAEATMDPGGVFATNTSTLPITGLATASVRPEKFIGLHFFSPVDKMQLVEIIKGEKSNDAALARAFDYVLSIGKVPIVVSDSRGFYTSRVFGTWTNEALALLAEGNHPHAIEMAGVNAGMPIGPLALLDEVSLTLCAHVRDQAVADIAAAGEDYVPHPGEFALDRMLALGRPGRAAGAGFYQYENGRKLIWPQLAATFMNGQPQLSQEEMVDRILFIQSIEAVRCLDEGVVHSVADANLGAILGWGYAPFHGGPLQFINAYGVDKFFARAEELCAAHGDRFAPPRLLREMAQRGESF